ncbi:MAG: hypothetical protein K2X27_14140, partial [Candidatus Obscuribacterales bacterium]|nr:hypothetical protein [Candidatus Obscuribacterales bacterium]
MKSIHFYAATVLLLAVLLFSAPLCKSQPATLKGQATHYADNSQPLDALLWPGNNFDKDAARALLREPSGESSIWAPIPEWEAGDWESKQAVNTRAVKYIGGQAMDIQPLGVHKSEGRFTKGLLRDRKGDIWHWFQSDYWTETDLGDLKVASYIRYSSPGGGEYPDFYAESVDFKILKASNQIATVRRSKTWTRYQDLGSGTLKEESVRTNYDERGTATATSFN